MGRPLALRPRPVGMTIGRLMLVSVAVAAVMWLARLDALQSSWERGLVIALGAALLARLLFVLYAGRRCPACKVGLMGRVGAIPFGDHFFRCPECGQRAKRFWLGRLWDASGPEDADRFRKKDRPVSTWGDGPIAPAPDRPETRTVGHLLRGKLQRDAESPDPVEVVPGASGWPDHSDGSTENRPRPASRSAPAGVKQQVADRFFRTLDAIRWSRNIRP